MQQEKQQGLNAVQSERRRQKSQADAAVVKARALEGEVASLRKTVEALQRDLDACRREAAQLKAAAQVGTHEMNCFPVRPSTQPKYTELHFASVTLQVIQSYVSHAHSWHLIHLPLSDVKQASCPLSSSYVVTCCSRLCQSQPLYQRSQSQLRRRHGSRRLRPSQNWLLQITRKGGRPWWMMKHLLLLRILWTCPASPSRLRQPQRLRP